MMPTTSFMPVRKTAAITEFAAADLLSIPPAFGPGVPFEFMIVPAFKTSNYSNTAPVTIQKDAARPLSISAGRTDAFDSKPGVA